MKSDLVFLGLIYTNFKRSEIAYKNYINDNNIYLHAKILKECNLLIRSLLLDNSFLLREELRSDAINLISHYDIWLEKWNDLDKKKAYAINDVFIFENEYVFPKESEKRLKAEFIKKNKI